MLELRAGLLQAPLSVDPVSPPLESSQIWLHLTRRRETDQGVVCLWLILSHPGRRLSHVRAHTLDAAATFTTFPDGCEKKKQEDTILYNTYAGGTAKQ